MAKKKSAKKVAKKKAAAKKATARKSTAAKGSLKKSAARKKSKKSTGAKSGGKKAATKKASSAKKKRNRQLPAKKTVVNRSVQTRAVGDEPSLGRPKATVDSKLDELFLRDFKAREVFDFLSVTTLRELEQYSPDEIIEKLTAPMVQTVTRIRKALAIRNRSLKDDKQFAAEFKKATQAQVGRSRRTN